MKLTDDDLAAWRALPVSEFLKDAMGRSITRQVEECRDAAWAGEPWSDARRLALHRVLAIHADIFTDTPAADFEKIMEIHEDE